MHTTSHHITSYHSMGAAQDRGGGRRSGCRSDASSVAGARASLALRHPRRERASRAARAERERAPRRPPLRERERARETSERTSEHRARLRPGACAPQTANPGTLDLAPGTCGASVEQPQDLVGGALVRLGRNGRVDAAGRGREPAGSRSVAQTGLRARREAATVSTRGLTTTMVGRWW